MPAHRPRRPSRALVGLAATVLLGCLLALSGPARAQTDLPPVLSYEGYLTTPAGAPLTGSYTLTFRLYEADTGGAVLWEESHAAAVVQGRVALLLGSIEPLLEDADIREFERALFLGVSIDGGTELTPRLPLASLPVVAQTRSARATVDVDCPTGGSITDAIAGAPLGERLTVRVNGPCTENVIIDRDFVTLQGVAGASITGITPDTGPGNAVVFVRSSSNVVLRDLDILGPAGDTTGMHGIHLTGASSVVLEQGTTVDDHDGNGVFVRGRSHLTAIDSFVRGNDLNGIYAKGRGNVDLQNTEVSGNTRSGVFLYQRSSGVFTESELLDNGDGVVELGFCKCALFLDGGSSARLLANNTLRSASDAQRIGAALSVYRDSSIRLTGSGNVIQNTAYDPAINSPNGTQDVGIAIDVGIGSVLLFAGGTATVNGWVLTYNLSTVDLRNVTIIGDVAVDGLQGNFRLWDESGVPDRVSLTGDIYVRGGFANIMVPPDPDAATIDGNIICGGSTGVPGDVRFADADDGYLTCPGIQTDVSASLAADVEPVALSGTVVYDVNIDNVKRTPAVEAQDVTVSVSFVSQADFDITLADTTNSLFAGSCDIVDDGNFNGNEFSGDVTCTFSSIVLDGALAQITVEQIQDALDVDVTVSVGNGDDNDTNDSDSLTTTVQ